MPGGSTGKTFAAVVTMLLVEDGVLSLDDPASKWLDGERWFRRLPNDDEILVRHLLSHSSGLGDYPYTMRYRMGSVVRAIRHGGIRFTPEELIGMIDRKSLYPVGRGYAYTDAGYLVLGRLIEAATGRTYYDLVRERILEPQGLDQIGLQDRSVLANITPGYMMGARNLRKNGTMKIDPSSEWTGGGLTTNPTMLVEFYGALTEGRIVKPESLALMLESGWRNPAEPDWHYGFGLFVYDDGETFGHGGLWPLSDPRHALPIVGHHHRRADQPRRPYRHAIRGQPDRNPPGRCALTKASGQCAPEVSFNDTYWSLL